jgi:hypothetical protein
MPRELTAWWALLFSVSIYENRPCRAIYNDLVAGAGFEPATLWL